MHMAVTKYTIKDQDGIQMAQTWDAERVEELREPHHFVYAETVSEE